MLGQSELKVGWATMNGATTLPVLVGALSELAAVVHEDEEIVIELAGENVVEAAGTEVSLLDADGDGAEEEGLSDEAS